MTKPTIEALALLMEGPSPNDIGTARDVGMPGGDGSYDKPVEEGLETFQGVARAMVAGSLRGGNVRASATDLIERALLHYGDIKMVADELSFVPLDADEFDGSRLELIDDHLVCFNGFDGRQLKRRAGTDGDLARGLVVLGSYVLKGMVQILRSKME